MWRPPPLSKEEVAHWKAQGCTRIEVVGHIELERPQDVIVDMTWRQDPASDVKQPDKGRCPFCER